MSIFNVSKGLLNDWCITSYQLKRRFECNFISYRHDVNSQCLALLFNYSVNWKINSRMFPFGESSKSNLYYCYLLQNINSGFSTQFFETKKNYIEFLQHRKK